MCESEIPRLDREEEIGFRKEPQREGIANEDGIGGSARQLRSMHPARRTRILIHESHGRDRNGVEESKENKEVDG